MGVILFALRHWTLPPGSLTFLIVGNGLLMTWFHLKEVYMYPQILVAVFVAGIAADVLYSLLRPSAVRVHALRLFAFAVPAILFALFFVILIITAGIWWSVHLWTGAVFLAGVIGLLLSYLTHPFINAKAPLHQCESTIVSRINPMTTTTLLKQHNPPGPPPIGTNLLAQLRFGLHVTGDPLNVMLGWFKQYGDVVHLQFGKEAHVYFLAHPDHFHTVLVEKANQFHKAGSYKDTKRGLARILGNGLVTSDGDYWRRQRKLIQPAFHTRRIEAYAEEMVRLTQLMLQGWQDGKTIEINDVMMRLTLAIVAKTILDTDIRSDAEKIAEAVTIFQHLAFGVDIFPL